MKRVLAVLVSSLVISAGAHAQVQPLPPGLESRIQTILYEPDRVIPLQVAPNYQLTLEFGPDERVESVAIGDGSWTVTPNKRGDYLFIKAGPGSASTNMTVVTDAGRYVFDLAIAGSASAQTAYTIRFRRPEARQALPIPTQDAVQGRYRLAGAKSVRPETIHDDGTKTYMSWPADQPIPAIFAIDKTGREQLLSGAIRSGLYVVDSVADKLVFRFNKQIATAMRLPPGRKK